MSRIFDGRYTARAEKPIVLFLIGMRFNKLLAVQKWLPVFRAMPRMLAELRRHPEAGMLSYRTLLVRPGSDGRSILGLVRQAARLCA